jgi:UDP-N-acetylglucosamine 2-epimerase
MDAPLTRGRSILIAAGTRPEIVKLAPRFRAAGAKWMSVTSVDTARQQQCAYQLMRAPPYNPVGDGHAAERIQGHRR